MVCSISSYHDLQALPPDVQTALEEKTILQDERLQKMLNDISASAGWIQWCPMIKKQGVDKVFMVMTSDARFMCMVISNIYRNELKNWPGGGFKASKIK